MERRQKTLSPVLTPVITWFAMMALVIMVAACAKPAQPSNMTVPQIPGANYGDFYNSIAVRNVTGGESTNPAWMSKVSNEDFRTALIQSLQANALYNEQDPKYVVDVDLVKVSQPVFQENVRVTTQVHYQLRSAETNNLVMNQTFITEDVSTQTESKYAVTRNRYASEGAISENIAKFLTSLSR